MAKKLTITDKRILQLPEILKSNKSIEYTKDFIAQIGMSKQNYYSIEREANQHFTLAQVEIICKAYGVDGNWLLGLQNDHVFSKIKPIRITQNKKDAIHY